MMNQKLKKKKWMKMIEELDEGQEDDDEYSDIGELPNEEEYREMIKNEEAE